MNQLKMVDVEEFSPQNIDTEEFNFLLMQQRAWVTFVLRKYLSQGNDQADKFMIETGFVDCIIKVYQKDEILKAYNEHVLQLYNQGQE